MNIQSTRAVAGILGAKVADKEIMLEGLAPTATGTQVQNNTAIWPFSNGYFSDMRRLALAFWVLSVFVCVVSSILAFSLLSGSWPYIVVSVLWAFFFGFTGMIYLKPKSITMAFGGLVGAGGTDAATGSGIVSAVDKQIAAIVEQASEVAQLDAQSTLLVNASTWGFFIILGICLLPAFLQHDQS